MSLLRPHRILRAVRRRAVRLLAGAAELGSLPMELGRSLDQTLGQSLKRLPDPPRRVLRLVHHGARRMMRTQITLSGLQKGLGHTLDQTLDLMPATPRRVIRIVQHRARRFIDTDVSLSGLQVGVERTLDRTVDLLPLHAHLLVGHGKRRDRQRNMQLAWSLAFVAGAVNAGGFLAVQSYTSHVSGAVSRAADELAVGHKALAFGAVSLVLCFMGGSFASGMLINLGRRRRFRSHYALSLMIEAGLLLAFGLMGAQLQQYQRLYLPVTVILLSFIMGMHNSVVTTISSAEVRTTHMTGIVTDLGLELSRLFYVNTDRGSRSKRIMANRDKLKLHGLILASFFVGGLAGALSFKHVGFKMTVPLAAFLGLLALRPILHELRVRWRLWGTSRSA